MNHKINYRILFCSLALVLLQVTGSAQETMAADHSDGSNFLLFGLATLVVFLIILLVMMINRLKGLDGQEAEPSISLKEWWNTLDKKLFTKAIPVEKEADFLLDHDYDGIKELDNSLPPWWKYGFYITIVVAVFYMLRYHVWKTGPDPEQEYNTEMKIAAAEIEAYRKQSNDMVDEKTVTMADAAGIAEGKKIYQANCFACHGANGEGGVGPNLTDTFWLHGGSINDVFKTIKYGVPDKGMQAWEKTYSPSQIKALASFVRSIVGTNPANAKAPQGDPYEEKAETQSTTAADTTAIVKN